MASLQKRETTLAVSKREGREKRKSGARLATLRRRGRLLRSFLLSNSLTLSHPVSSRRRFSLFSRCPWRRVACLWCVATPLRERGGAVRLIVTWPPTLLYFPPVEESVPRPPPSLFFFLLKRSACLQQPPSHA